MNIFVLDKKPHVAVQMLCDCHVRKMCLETAQILSGVMFRKGLKLSDNMPKPQSINHPVIAAVAEDKDDAIAWVLDYNQELQTEFCRRFGKHHLYTDLVYNYVSELWDWSEGGIGGLAKCCGDCRNYFKCDSACKNDWACEDFEPQGKTLFDRITASPEVLAPNLVYFVSTSWGEAYWTSTITEEKEFESYEDAIAATVAKLKEVAE